MEMWSPNAAMVADEYMNMHASLSVNASTMQRGALKVRLLT